MNEPKKKASKKATKKSPKHSKVGGRRVAARPGWLQRIEDERERDFVLAATIVNHAAGKTDDVALSDALRLAMRLRLEGWFGPLSDRGPIVKIRKP